jgi:hypothetical protein
MARKSDSNVTYFLYIRTTLIGNPRGNDFVICYMLYSNQPNKKEVEP